MEALDNRLSIVHVSFAVIQEHKDRILTRVYPFSKGQPDVDHLIVIAGGEQ